MPSSSTRGSCTPASQCCGSPPTTLHTKNLPVLRCFRDESIVSDLIGGGQILSVVARLCVPLILGCKGAGNTFHIFFFRIHSHFFLSISNGAGNNRQSEEVGGRFRWYRVKETDWREAW